MAYSLKPQENRVLLEKTKHINNHLRNWQALFFFALHIPIVLLFRESEITTTVHALLTLLIGLFWVIKDKEPDRPILVLAYIAGAELLWRGLHAHVFWEYGKYSTIILLLAMLLKYKGPYKMDSSGIIFIILLIPSIFLLPSFDREAISFNLSGPLAISLAVTFFSQVQLSKELIRNLLIAFIAPIVGLATLTLLGIFSTPEIIFLNDSLYSTSAGIGPNQVSSTLGLGVLGAFFLLVLMRRYRFTWLIVLGIFFWLLIQDALTFSRGGLWTTAIALLTAGYFLWKDKQYKHYLIGTIVIVGLIGIVAVFPVLNRYTGNALQVRFSSLDLTKRDILIRAELKAFQENPWFGVGPGQSGKYFEAILGKSYDSHTEYTRLLGEHGILGGLAILVLIVITLNRLFKKTSPYHKMYALSFTAWALFYMTHSATRTVAPSLLFGLASAIFIDSTDE